MTDRGRDFIAKRIAVEDRGYSSPCWVWQKGLTKKGYARASVPSFPRQVRVHRASYELHVGPIPEGLTIDHLCCVKSCCNPAHLEPVTDEENRRRAGAGVKQTHCKQGHELAGDNVRTAKDGNRFCVICRRVRHREYMRAWHARNADRIRERSFERRQANREIYNANRRAKRAADRLAA